MNINPPNIGNDWDTNNVWSQAQLIAYSQLREYEDSQEREQLLKVIAKMP